MAKGSYNISVSGDSSLEEERKNNNKNQECMKSCLSPAFLRSLSFHDRPRSSRVPINKELCKNRYKTLASSLEKIPSNPSPSSEARSECGTTRGFESVGINAETEMNTQLSTYRALLSVTQQQTRQNHPSEHGFYLEDEYMRLSVESEKLLEKTVAILRTVDKDVSESLKDLTKPESIALESVMEIYRNKGRNAASAEFVLSKESSSIPIYENLQPCIQQRPNDVQVHSNSRRSKNLLAHCPPQSTKNMQTQSARQISKSLQTLSSQQNENTNTSESFTNLTKPKSEDLESVIENCKSESTADCSFGAEFDLPTDSSSEPIYENWQPSIQQRSEDIQVHSTPRRQNNLKAHSVEKSPMTGSTQQSLKNLSTDSCQSIANNLKVRSFHQSPKNGRTLSSQPNSTNLLVNSSQDTSNCESLLNSNSENTLSLNKPNSIIARSVEIPRSSLSSSKISAEDNTTKVKCLFEFDLPSDHEQFLKIIGALQNRCLEYREMIQDIAVSALEECLNFSERSFNRITHFRKQFASQKTNFRDFKELCCKSVVFGPDSLPINEKVTEVIQSFYLKLLQEENETFMARLEFGLKLGEMYAKMIKLEIESRKAITTLENEILYLKKTSVGFKV